MALAYVDMSSVIEAQVKLVLWRKKYFQVAHYKSLNSFSPYNKTNWFVNLIEN